MGIFDIFKKPAAEKKADISDNQGYQGYDLQSIVFVTADCLEKKQINWASRSSDLVHEHDSGWQCWTGLEPARESEDISSARIISLQEALILEPLLEQILEKTEGLYYCDRTLQQFVEVRRNI